MADKIISELTAAGEVYDDSLLVMEQQGEARSVEGRLLKEYAVAAAKEQAEIAAESAEAAKKAETGAAESLARLDGQVALAEAARAGAEEARDAIEGMTVSAETLPSGSVATAEKTAADGAFNIHFGIPAGMQGDAGPQGEPGVSPTVEVSKEGKTTTVTITDAEGSHQFDIMDGMDGTGAGDMTKDVYDPTGRETDVFDYVDKALENVVVDLPAHLVVGDDGELGAVLPVDADTLDGHPAEYFASNEGMQAAIEEAMKNVPLGLGSNMLDNADFRNPVNQRGQEEYTEPGYTIDRWDVHLANAGKEYSLTIEDGWIKIVNKSSEQLWFSEGIELTELSALKDRFLTLSVLYKCDHEGSSFHTAMDGNGKPYTYIIPQTPLLSDRKINLTSNTKIMSTDPTGYGRFIGCNITVSPGGTLYVKAAKLELGDHQTLAHQDENGEWVLNENPDPITETIKCMRYYQVFDTSSQRPTKARDFRPPMRINPTTTTISIDGATCYVADANL